MGLADNEFIHTIQGEFRSDWAKSTIAVRRPLTDSEAQFGENFCMQLKRIALLKFYHACEYLCRRTDLSWFHDTYGAV